MGSKSDTSIKAWTSKDCNIPNILGWFKEVLSRLEKKDCNIGCFVFVLISAIWLKLFSIRPNLRLVCNILRLYTLTDIARCQDSH